MTDSVVKHLAELPELSKPVLAELWRQLFKKNPPPEMRRDLMLRMVAHSMQEKAFGSLNEASCRRLAQFAKTFEANPHSSASKRHSIKPGTRLMREWKEQVHVVNVEEEGFEYKGSRYQSLSEIARLITGTRWSGPLFFGLKRTQGIHEAR